MERKRERERGEREREREREKRGINIIKTKEIYNVFFFLISFY